MWYGGCGTLNAQYHLNFIDANMYAKVGSQSLTSIALLCHDQRPLSTIRQNHPQNPLLVLVIETYVGAVVNNNVNLITYFFLTCNHDTQLIGLERRAVNTARTPLVAC